MILGTSKTFWQKRENLIIWSGPLYFCFHDFFNNFFKGSIKSQLQKTKDAMPQGLMREVMETYKPHILSRRRQLIEDCVRDLRLNNDHIHIIEQEMRRSIQQGLSKTEHDSSRFVFPLYFFHDFSVKLISRKNMRIDIELFVYNLLFLVSNVFQLMSEICLMARNMANFYLWIWVALIFELLSWNSLQNKNF